MILSMKRNWLILFCITLVALILFGCSNELVLRLLMQKKEEDILT